jgi:hypothetical protein
MSTWKSRDTVIPHSPTTLHMFRIEKMLHSLLFTEKGFPVEWKENKCVTSELHNFVHCNILSMSQALRLCSDQMIRIALFYLHRYMTHVRHCPICCHHVSTCGRYMTINNIETLKLVFIACCVLAAKMYHDYDLRCSCSFILKHSLLQTKDSPASNNNTCIKLSDLNRMEAIVLEYLDGKLLVSQKELDEFTKELLSQPIYMNENK